MIIKHHTLVPWNFIRILLQFLKPTATKIWMKTEY